MAGDTNLTPVQREAVANAIKSHIWYLHYYTSTFGKVAQRLQNEASGRQLYAVHSYTLKCRCSL